MSPRSLLLLGLLLLLSTAVQANDVRIEPAAPTTDTPITVHLFGSTTPCGPESVAVRVTGRRVSLTAPPAGPCVILPAPGWTRAVRIGTLPAGVYELDVNVPDSGQGVVLRRTLIVGEAQPLFDVRPNVASRAEDVLIVSRGPAFCESLNCHPRVRFGDVDAASVALRGTHTLLVRLPQLAPGTYDVTIGEGDTQLRRGAAFHWFGAGPIERAFFEPVLLPVLFRGPGVFGSDWDTEVVLRNGNEFPLSMPILSVFETPPCFPVCEGRMPAMTTRKISGVVWPNGRIEFVSRQAAPRLGYNLLIRDRSRQSAAFGTEVPVVREDDLYARTFWLNNVPADPRFRSSLRLYALDPVASRTVSLVFRDRSGDTLLTQDLLVPKTSGDIREPAMLTIPDIVARWPLLAGKGEVTIEITPGFALAPAFAPRIWGFASVTNNETQHVTVISPH